jgi:hypothetical protein
MPCSPTSPTTGHNDSDLAPYLSGRAQAWCGPRARREYFPREHR